MTTRERHYRAIIAHALELGVTRSQVAEAIDALRGAPADLEPEALRTALYQYVPDNTVRRLLTGCTLISPVVPGSRKPRTTGLSPFLNMKKRPALL